MILSRRGVYQISFDEKGAYIFVGDNGKRISIPLGTKGYAFLEAYTNGGGGERGLTHLIELGLRALTENGQKPLEK